MPLAFAVGSVSFKPPIELSYTTLDLLPLYGVPSVSSLSVLKVIESRISTRERFTLAAFALNLPPSSWNLRRYVPAKAGAITSVTFPAAASITSCAD